MVLYSGSRAARNAQSISNKTSVYGIMNGLVPQTGGNYQNRIQQRIRGTTNITIPLNPIPGLAYMTRNNQLSVNPACAGGVGKRVLLMACR